MSSFCKNGFISLKMSHIQLTSLEKCLYSEQIRTKMTDTYACIHDSSTQLGKFMWCNLKNVTLEMFACISAWNKPKCSIFIIVNDQVNTVNTTPENSLKPLYITKRPMGNFQLQKFTEFWDLIYDYLYFNKKKKKIILIFTSTSDMFVF